MLIFIIASLIPVHLLCLPVASIDDRQLYLGIFPSFKDFNSSLEIFSNFILVISELSAYMLAFPCSRTALPSPCYQYHVALLTTSLWHAPEIKCKWGKLCNQRHAELDTIEYQTEKVSERANAGTPKLFPPVLSLSTLVAH